MPEIKARVIQVSASASEGVVRNHRITIDRPESKGGGNAGAMGGELLLVGLGGCFMSNLLAAIQSRNSPISNVLVDITGTLVPDPMRFSAVHLSITGDYEDKAELTKLVTIAERSCIVANSIKSGIELSFSVE